MKMGLDIQIVFCGNYADYFRALNFKKVMALADELRVRERVHYIGRVPDDDMPALYRLSSGLVMPTFFGPTNIPPLEAWNFGRPVIASDISGMRAQIGDAGLLLIRAHHRTLPARCCAFGATKRWAPNSPNAASGGSRRTVGKISSMAWRQLSPMRASVFATGVHRVIPTSICNPSLNSPSNTSAACHCRLHFGNG